MRLGRVYAEDQVYAVVLDGDGPARKLRVDDPVDPLLSLVRDPEGLLAAATKALTDDTVDLSSARVMAPIARPGKIIAVGLNYLDHTAETGMAAPTAPLTFAKYSSSVTGATDDIIVPSAQTSQVDYEAELAVIVGGSCPTDGSADSSYVVAFTVANDVSARDVQFADGQWTRGKSFDTFTPLGPWLVTPDEIPDPQSLHIWTEVNGDRVQDDTTKSMVFDLDALLSHISSGVTLEAGDVILTGTPSGAGGFDNPPRFLNDGDVVTVGVDGVGVLRNTVRFR
jgi:2-keto-4-pentenoate hydratase/2-oxohepta-3-ene-1,7-dioic acid hydratase in catechol pathway